MFQWYVVNTYSGHENKVKQNLEHRIQSMGAQRRFRRVVVPTETVIETKDGQKVQTEKRVLPGYVLVEDPPRERIQCLRDRRDLREHVDAVTVLLDHAAHTADLTLDAGEAS